ASRRYCGQAEAQGEVPVRRLETAAVGRTAVPGVEAPATAPGDPIRGRTRRDVRINTARQLLLISVPTPLPHIAMHIAQAPGVRLIARHRRRLPQKGTLGRAAVGVVAVEIRLRVAQAFPKGEHPLAPGPARILPLGLRRQPNLPARWQNPLL